MEKSLEDFFGPGGSLRKSVDSAKKDLTDKLEDMRESVDKALTRNKRAVSEHSLITNQVRRSSVPANHACNIRLHQSPNLGPLFGLFMLSKVYAADMA